MQRQTNFRPYSRRTRRQIYGLELIASDFASDEKSWKQLDQQICGRISWKKYYGGCEVVDVVEQIAIDRAKELFGLNMPMCSHIQVLRLIQLFSLLA
jgi:glycine/serine hydroxymethyltransferase